MWLIHTHSKGGEKIWYASNRTFKFIHMLVSIVEGMLLLTVRISTMYGTVCAVAVQLE